MGPYKPVSGTIFKIGILGVHVIGGEVQNLIHGRTFILQNNFRIKHLLHVLWSRRKEKEVMEYACIRVGGGASSLGRAGLSRRMASELKIVL